MPSRSKKTLDQLITGEKAIVKSVISRNRILASKLLAMGIVAGTVVEVSRIAPLGDPMKIRCKGYDLSLRMTEARAIQIDQVN